jgi:putative transposase
MASRVLLFTRRLFSVGFEFRRAGLRFGRSLIRRRTSLVAENLFLRKQLAAYVERNSKPCRLSDTDRLTLLLLSRCFAWRRALVVVKPETLVGWHWKALQLSGVGNRVGRPRVPGNLRALIAEMVRENPTCGQLRVTSELALKLGMHISPKTIRAYWSEEREPSHRRHSQRWMTFHGGKSGLTI